MVFRRFYCALLEDECITVRVKEKQRRGTHVKYSYGDSYTTVEASYYTLEDNTIRCATDLGIINYQPSYDRLVSQLEAANTNNPPGNELNNSIGYDRVASGGVEGVWQPGLSKLGHGHFLITSNQGYTLHFNGTAEAGVQTVNEQYAYSSVSEGGTPVYRVYIQENCQMRLLATSDDGKPFSVRRTLQPLYCYLTLHDVDGIVGQTRTFKTQGRPRYLELLNAEEIEVETAVHKLNKADYLPGVFTKQLEATDHAYNFVPRTLDLIEPYIEIPKHCWNIYMVAYPFPTPFLLISTADVQFIMQICTDDPGTFERPILEVSCGCGESCPDGTCPVECTDHVCCYGSDGISLREIPLSNYDG